MAEMAQPPPGRRSIQTIWSLEITARGIKDLPGNRLSGSRSSARERKLWLHATSCKAGA